MKIIGGGSASGGDSTISYNVSSLREASDELKSLAKEFAGVEESFYSDSIGRLKNSWTGENSEEYIRKANKVGRRLRKLKINTAAVGIYTSTLADRAELADKIAKALVLDL